MDGLTVIKGVATKVALPNVVMEGTSGSQVILEVQAPLVLLDMILSGAPAGAKPEQIAEALVVGVAALSEDTGSDMDTLFQNVVQYLEGMLASAKALYKDATVTDED